MISAEPVAEPMRLGGDLDHLTTHLEPLAEVVDIRTLVDCRAKQMTRNEQLAGEGVGLLFHRRTGPVCRAEKMMAEFMRDRKAFPHFRLASDELDPVVDQTRTETSEGLHLHDLETLEARERPHGDGWRGDVPFTQHAAGHFACMRRVRLLRPTGTAWDSEKIVWRWPIVDVDGQSRCAALRALILEARGSVEAESAIFLCAPQIRHARPRTDYRPVVVHRIGGFRGPAVAVISACRRDSGDPLPTEEATMDKKERKLFKELDRLRVEDGGLGEKLERYRQSRAHYDRLVKGREDTSRASLPVQGSQRRASAHGPDR
jgi:hypothetical protein